MGFIKSLFGDAQPTNTPALPWNPITSLEQWEQCLTASHTQPVVIFKHSTRCSISRMALKQFEQQFNQQSAIKPYFLDLLAHREVSNAIAHHTQVQHQSPQVILLQHGKAIYNASHESIDATVLETQVQ